jgi:hypothetical protein
MNAASHDRPADVDFGPSLLRETEVGSRLIRTFRDTGTRSSVTGSQRFTTWVYVAARLTVAQERFSEAEALDLHEREITTAREREPQAEVTERYPPAPRTGPASTEASA